MWSSRGQSYLGVTVHFINEYFNRESYLLAFKQLFLRQNYVYLAQPLDNIFNDYDIKIEQITHIVTDGGIAFCKMFKEFGNIADQSVMQDTSSEGESDDVATTTSSGNNCTTASSEDIAADVVRPFM